ncbi:phage portal protein [Flavobacterium sp. 102]|uniref:phage portal protein n=1 Tax=Flavobacterium sp. 102 TaxID=2135623 RepID=UPI000EB025F2|nr:phage portal protein [Flavobacterium sp. 102]RKS00423.1 SPP1 family phage portal protein [Flavobacterium sp. 102]
MEDIFVMLGTDPKKAIELLKSQGKKADEIQKLIKEFTLTDRTIRFTQIGNIQKDKKVGEKTVDAVRIPINFQQKIVTTSVAFEVGEPATLIPNDMKLKMAELIKNLWKSNRIDSKIQRLKTVQKSETQAAMLFFMSEIKPGSLIEKLLVNIGISGQKKEIKCSVLENSKGTMYPYFDAYQNMIAFTWSFISKTSDGKDQKNTWIYSDKNVYKFIDEGIVPEVLPHGFDKIPIVYVSQEQPEWFITQAMIDRIEVAVSKLGASNDYSGHPMLIIEGDVTNAPDKDEDGKAWMVPVKIDSEGNVIKGSVSFLEAKTAPASNKLEIETIEKFIYNISSTPNLSLDNLMGLGTSGVALELMFLDPILKAKSNEGENRTMYERILNIMISGIITTTNTGLKSEAAKLFFDVQFNSILPNDLKKSADIASVLKTAGLISTRTGIEYIGMNADVEQELEFIKSETAATEPKPPTGE